MPLIYVGRARFEEGGRPHFSINAYRHKWMLPSGGTFISKQRLIARRPSRNLRDKKKPDLLLLHPPLSLAMGPLPKSPPSSGTAKRHTGDNGGGRSVGGKGDFCCGCWRQQQQHGRGGGDRGGRLFCPSLSLCIPDSITWPSSLFFFFFPPCVLVFFRSLPPGLTIT